MAADMLIRVTKRSGRMRKEQSHEKVLKASSLRLTHRRRGKPRL